MIVICKIGESQPIANLIKAVVYSAYQEGGVIRKIYNLGDRVTDKSYRAKDGSTNNVVRYFCLYMDLNPNAKRIIEIVMRNNIDCLQVFSHALKEADYFKLIFNKDAWKEEEVPVNKLKYKEELTNLLAKSKILIPDKFEEKFDSLKNKLL